MRRHADLPGALNRAIDTADRHPWGEVALVLVLVAYLVILLVASGRKPR